MQSKAPRRTKRAPRACGRRRSFAHDAGFTLVEILIAASLFSVVALATLALFDFANRRANIEIGRDTAVSETSAGLNQMLGEIRNAYQINGPATETSDWIDFLIRPSATTNYRVIYNCNVSDPKNSGYNACFRYRVSYSPSAGLTTAAGTVPSGAEKSCRW